MGFLYGTSYEIVYQGAGSRDYLSELQWNIKPLLYLGINLEFGPQKPQEKIGFFSAIGIKAAFPGKTGTMEDRDWMTPCTVPGALTHFSSHDNYTERFFFANLDTGFSIPIKKLVLKCYFNIDYMYFRWEARDGYIQYGDNYYKRGTVTDPYIPWNSGFQTLPLYGAGIAYAQNWILFNTGIGAELTLGRFTIQAAFFIGPSICIAIDDHRLRNIRYTGSLTQGFFIKPKLDVFFSLSSHFDIGLSAAWWYTGETRGDTEIRESNSTYTVWDAEGAQLKAFEGTLALRYRF